jgi:hypothetical protein
LNERLIELNDPSKDRNGYLKKLTDDLSFQIAQFVQLNHGKIDLNSSSEDQIGRFIELTDGKIEMNDPSEDQTDQFV